MKTEDEFFEDLEESINEIADSPERVAFYNWEKRFETDFKIGSKYDSDCRHSQKTLNPNARMVQCDKCQAFLDPYEVLERLIRDRQSQIHHRQMLSKEVEKFQNQVENLKKELRSLNGKIKRRKVKIGE